LTDRERPMEAGEVLPDEPTSAMLVLSHEECPRLLASNALVAKNNLGRALVTTDVDRDGAQPTKTGSRRERTHR
jgi:hypothetical protein